MGEASVLAAVLAAFPCLVVGGGAGAEEARSFDLAIRDGRVPADRRTVRVTEGDRVVLRWTSDRPVVLHLHGYDIETRVAPGAVATMTVEAHTAGRFPIEIHGAGGRGHANVAYLEVHPR